MAGNKPCDAPCMRCGSPLRENDDFCAECGTLVAEGLMCQNHPGEEADAACVICLLPYCRQCGSFVHGLFLCRAHAGYEILGGNVRVYAALEKSSAERAEAALAHAGLHPRLHAEKRPDDAREPGEVKIMVPRREVQHAEQILKGLPG